MKFYRNSALCVIFLITHNALSFGQVNHVANPSFEEMISCPSGANQVNKAIGWSTLINGGGGNPELFAVCCTQQWACGVPSHAINWGFQYPLSGNNYVGIDVIYNLYPNNFREYVQSKLIFKLKESVIYCVKFYVNLSDFQQVCIKTLGAYFDNGSVSALGPHGLAAVIPQIYNNSLLLNDTVSWIKIEGSFVASGNEEYVTLGNFFPDSLSGIGFFGSQPTNWGSYYNIDDISLIDANLPAYAGNDTLIQPGDSVFIGRQPEIGLDEDCIWFVNGVPIDTVAGLWVWPDSTTTYILEQTICGNVSWDTVTVSVYGTGLAEATHGLTRGFGVYPNPATNLLTIESPLTNATLCITNMLGQEVLRQEVREKIFSVDVSKLGKGIYFVYLHTEKGEVVRRFVKE